MDTSSTWKHIEFNFIKLHIQVELILAKNCRLHNYTTNIFPWNNVCHYTISPFNVKHNKTFKTPVFDHCGHWRFFLKPHCRHLASLRGYFASSCPETIHNFFSHFRRIILIIMMIIIMIMLMIIIILIPIWEIRLRNQCRKNNPI